jgi:hypothetical protein
MSGSKPPEVTAVNLAEFDNVIDALSEACKLAETAARHYRRMLQDRGLEPADDLGIESCPACGRSLGHRRNGPLRPENVAADFAGLAPDPVDDLLADLLAEAD